jgi:glutaredoxin 3
MSAADPHIVMYSSAFCGYCAAAKSLLRQKNVEFTEIDVLAQPEKRDEMIARSGRRTVPQIFIGSRHVGGFDDHNVLEKSGELDALIAAATNPQST